MKVIYVNADNLAEVQAAAKDVAMALGYFDGVHLGHQQVIQAAKRKAQQHNLSSAVLSFFPHPKSILQPDVPFTYLEPIAQKIEKLEKLGIDYFYVVEFTKALSKVEGDVFLDQYVKALRAKEIVCGFDYKYGTKSQGSVETLAAYAKRNQLGFTVVEELKWNQQKISSTLIRQCLRERQLQAIPQLMGCFYKTKHCKKNGLFPNYSLPSLGSYKVLIENNGHLVEDYVTVESPKKISIHYSDREQLPDELVIQWIDQVESISS